MNEVAFSLRLMKQFAATLLLVIISNAARAQPDTLRKPEARFNLHFQSTYIYQYSGRFKSPYSGPNSLSGDEEKQNSITTTLYGGARLWKGATAYINPEIAGGSGLSGALGMGGSSNGETFRVGNPAPSLYLGRLFFVQTFSIGKSKREQAEDGANVLSTFEPEDHLRFVIGKYSLGDLFDNNAFSNSPRTQFLNWSLMNNGAWDYAANVRGYTLAFSTELAYHNMAYKLAIATLPKEANGPELETNLSKSLSLYGEVDRQYKWRGREGNVRLLGYYNRTHMGAYKEAIIPPALNPYPFTPDIDATQKDGRTKTGIGLNADQEINDDLGLFARLGWNDGKNETWCFTEIDRTASLGAVLKGKSWHRGDDVAGAALVVNGLSKEHREYLRQGGQGFILGDGTLTYAPEAIAEFYYAWKPVKTDFWLTADYQFCLNPGYNKDRGPANIISLRVHVEL